MSIRTFGAIFAFVAVAACNSTPREPIVRTVEVLVPTPVTCVPASANLEPKFQVSRGDVAAAYDAAERLRLTAAGFLERDAYINEILPVARGCK